MFTGIIEATGEVVGIKKYDSNIDFTIKTKLAKDAYIDQSISHNGVCLTVVSFTVQSYVVTAIKETLDVSNLSSWVEGTVVNLERSMLPNTRLDGHFVQGHVDTITECINIEEVSGSWYFSFKLLPAHRHYLVHKGSVSINGTSLTVIHPDSKMDYFKVAIIPFTYNLTNFKFLSKGDKINIEFDILGKYISRQLDLRGI